MSGWPQDPAVESLKRTLRRTQGELAETRQALHDLATHIEWEDDRKPLLDTFGLVATWGRVELILDRHGDTTVNEIPTGRMPRQNGQSGPTRPMDDRLCAVLERVRLQLRESRGVDVVAPMTDVERHSWIRELAIEAMVAVAATLDPATGAAFHPDAVARFRRRRAVEALLRVIELATLNGVSADVLLQVLEPSAPQPTPLCPECGGKGMSEVRSRYLGAPDDFASCPKCKGTGLEPRG